MDIRLWLAVAVFASACPALGAQDPGGTTVILDTSGFWRTWTTLKTPVMRHEDGRIEPLPHPCDTPFPPADWTKPGFDDTSWSRGPGVTFPSVRNSWAEISHWDVGAVSLNLSSPALALVAIRGKFAVTDPSQVKGLRFSVQYRGGVVVTVNGREAARGHLPAGTPIGMDTLADGYPRDAYLYPDGSLLDHDYRKADAVKDRYMLRTRELTDVPVPSALLCKGTNVVAIELHRAPIDAFLPARLKDKTQGYEIVDNLWDTCGLVAFRLKADAPDGVVANVTRPKGFQVWNSDVMSPDFDLDFGEPNEPLRPVRIVGTCNGLFSGKVVIASDEAIRELRAAVSPLVRRGAAGAIPPEAVRVRYALPDGTEDWVNAHYAAFANRFDGLEDAAPDEVPVRTKSSMRDNRVRPGQPPPVFGAMQPVWVTVKVPQDAVPGDYEGTLTVTAKGIDPVRVPLQLKVHGWRLPEPSAFRTFAEIVQSPDSLALQYNVPMWSNEHFDLIERSFRALGEAGIKTVYVPLICHTNLGNSQSMVRWVRKPGGGWGHDFTVLERYLDLYQKHCGKPEAVCLGVWEVFLEGGSLTYSRTGKYVPEDIWEDFDKAKGHGPLVTEVDPETHEVKDLQLPLYTESEKSKALWKPLFDQLRERLARRGWEDRLLLGYVHDAEPAKEVVEFLTGMMPGTPWLRQAHSERKDLHGASYGLQMGVWSPGFVIYPDSNYRGGWRKPSVQFPRNLRDGFPLTTFRLIGEMNITGDQRGFGRLGGDYWPVLKDRRGLRTGTVATRYPKTLWRALIITTAMLSAGKDGPLATARTVMMGEGLQECEARIFIEEALLDEASRRKLPADLAARCDRLLRERTTVTLLTLDSHQTSGFLAMSPHTWWGTPSRVGQRWFLSSGWQQRSESLYGLADEVGRAMEGR